MMPTAQHQLKKKAMLDLSVSDGPLNYDGGLPEAMNNKHDSLPPQVRKESITTLKRAVAELFGLLSRVRQAHQKARGVTLLQLDDFSGRIMGHIDYVAKRATDLGGSASRIHRETAGQAPFKLGARTPKKHLLDEKFADVHLSTRGNVRQAVKDLINAQDFGSADVLADVLRTLDSHRSLSMTSETGSFIDN